MPPHPKPWQTPWQALPLWQWFRSPVVPGEDANVFAHTDLRNPESSWQIAVRSPQWLPSRAWTSPKTCQETPSQLKHCAVLGEAIAALQLVMPSTVCSVCVFVCVCDWKCCSTSPIRCLECIQDYPCTKDLRDRKQTIYSRSQLIYRIFIIKKSYHLLICMSGSCGCNGL